MKNTSSFRLIYLLIITNIQIINAQYFTQFYEAEESRFTNMIKLVDTSASNGEYLCMKDTGEVSWEIFIKHNGYYNINIRYRTNDWDKEQYFIKNRDTIPIGFGISENWNIFTQPFYLDSGINELVLCKSWGYMDIDWISIDPANVKPEMSPQKISFYKQYPHQIVIKIDNFHQGVKAILLNDQSVTFRVKPYPYLESAIWVELLTSSLIYQPEGLYNLKIQLDSSEIIGKLAIYSEPHQADLIIVAPDVEHGNSVLFRLPSGRNLLIDCGKDWARDSIIIPMLHRNQIDTIHTFIITHYHNDHDSGDKGEQIINQFHVQNFIDYKTYKTGYAWKQDSIYIKILNSFEDGFDENSSSLSLKIKYKDFVYIHGGDTYAENQQQILKHFPEDIGADVFSANHHFHGSVYPGYIREMNPDLVFIQAQEAIYARDAYMVKYKKESEEFLNKKREHPIETLAALEVGTIVIRIDNDGEWWYETYREQDSVIIPGIASDNN